MGLSLVWFAQALEALVVTVCDSIGPYHKIAPRYSILSALGSRTSRPACAGVSA